MEKIDQISKAMNAADEETRLQGLRALAAGDASRGLDLLFQAFGDASWRVRKAAIDLFLSLPASRSLAGEIIELLHAEENAGLRNAGVEILTRMGREVVPMLLDQAGCADHDVRKFIVDILGDIAAPEAVPTLVGALHDHDSNVRAAAAENLGKLKSTRAVPALLAAMQHADLLLQFTILDALSRIAAPVPLAELLPYKDEKLLRKALIDCLGKTGDASAIPELVAALGDAMGNVREAAMLALVEIADRFPQQVRRQLTGGASAATAAALATSLGEAHPPLRSAAIRLLGWLGAGEAVAPLLGLLDDESLQAQVLEALVDIARVNPHPLLAAWPLVSGSRRAGLAYVLGEAPLRQGLALLRQGLAESDTQVVRLSAYALGRLGDAEILAELVGCLQNAAREVQEAASQALIALGGRLPKETLAALRPLLRHSDARQRMLALMVARELDDPAVLPTLGMALKDPAAEVRRSAVRGFEGCDVTEYLSTLLLSLTDEDAEVRRAVVDILAACSHDEAWAGLPLALQDEDMWVRSSALRGLGKLGGERARALVEQGVDDPVGLVKIAALETLASLAGAGATPRLLAALEDADEDVVSAAMQLLTTCAGSGWLGEHAARLLDHPFSMVRAQVARSAVEALGAAARPLLEKRLAVEDQALLRRQLAELLDELPVS